MTMTAQSDHDAFFDGDLAIPLTPDLLVDDTTLTIRLEGRDPVRWPLADIRIVADQGYRDMAMLRNIHDPVARLATSDRSLLARCPNLRKRAPVKGRGRLLKWAVGAVASVALIVGVLVPRMADQLSTYISASGEKALGDATFDQIRSALDRTGLNPIETCKAPAGIAALEVMKDKLTADLDLPAELTVHVLDHDMVNAFALPGGYVVFFKGLIDAAETPEEVAAVFGHEIGHVVSRDPTRHAMRSAGSIGVLGLLFGDFAGGAIVLFLTERLIVAQYSQEAETDADVFAYDRLREANVSPEALGDIFQRLKDEHGEAEGVVAHFLSHPGLTERIKAARAAARDSDVIEPILTDAQWADLKAICGSKARQVPPSATLLPPAAE